VYAARLGAGALAVGLLTVGPALANLTFALPAGQWLERQPVDTAVFWTAVFHRFFYALWPLLPLFLAPNAQIASLVGLTLLMHIPGTALAVGFNALFAEAVPPEWRGHVAGIRNALLSAVLIVMSLVCGQILIRVPFPLGYQIVFGLGFVGALMSTVHLWFIVPCPENEPSPPRRRSLRDLSWPRLRQRRPRQVPGRPRRSRPAIDVLRGPYARLLAVIAVFHVAWYLPIPLFPVFYVNDLHLTDSEIGLGSALFYASAFVAATQIARLVRRIGNRRLSAIGGMLLALFPGLLAVARGLTLFLAASAAGGVGWSLFSGSLINLVLEKAPKGDRTTHLAWYTLAINAAAMTGALIGPLVGGWIGLALALAIFAALRLAAGLAIWRWA
jgi:MFS family permease